MAAPYSVHSTGYTMWYCWSHGLGKNRAHTTSMADVQLQTHRPIKTLPPSTT
jgi:hypothetical protein